MRGRSVVQIGIKNRDRWTWLRRFRAWEANRKVFQQPENWIDPEPGHDEQVRATKTDNGLKP